LRAHGFHNINFYWAYPAPDTGPAAFWLPLQARGAIQYFVKSRPKDPNLLRHWVHSLLRLAWIFTRSHSLAVPVSCVAEKGKGTSALTGLDQRVQAHWREWGFGTPPQKFTRLLLSGGERSINKAVALLFDARASEPRVAIKMSRVPAAVPALDREEQVLEALARTATPGIPRVLFSDEFPPCLADAPRPLGTYPASPSNLEGYTRMGMLLDKASSRCSERMTRFSDEHNAQVLGETVLKGVPLYTRLTRSTFHRLALDGTAWLIQLAQQGAPVVSDDWHTRLIRPVLSDFSRNFGAVADQQQLRLTRARLAALQVTHLVPEHRDFSPWNVMLGAENRLAVLDWESAELRGLPGLDLIYYLTYLAFFLEGALESKQVLYTYCALLDPTTMIGSVWAECTMQYATAVGMAPDQWSALSLLTWLLHSRSEHQRLWADNAGEPSPTQLRSSLFFTLWALEITRSPGIWAGK
jgi:hypothetical protein